MSALNYSKHLSGEKEEVIEKSLPRLVLPRPRQPPPQPGPRLSPSTRSHSPLPRISKRSLGTKVPAPSLGQELILTFFGPGTYKKLTLSGWGQRLGGENRLTAFRNFQKTVDMKRTPNFQIKNPISKTLDLGRSDREWSSDATSRP